MFTHPALPQLLSVIVPSRNKAVHIAGTAVMQPMHCESH